MSLTKYDVLPNHSSEADVFCYMIIHPSASQWTFKRIEIPSIPPLHPDRRGSVQPVSSWTSSISLQSWFLSRLEQHCEGDSFWQKGCKEVGIKRGLGQSTAALSSLSISLMTTPSRLLSLCLVSSGLFCGAINHFSRQPHLLCLTTRKKSSFFVPYLFS